MSAMNTPPNDIRPDAPFDFLVIGGGSGGVRAARIAASHGARVALVESDRLGGTCVNVGCVPKKLLVYASEFGADFEDAAGFGWTVGPRQHDWAALIEAKDREVSRLNGVYERLLLGSGVTLIRGRAKLVDAHTVQVGDTSHRAERILIATGGWPDVPEVMGREHVISSNEAFSLPRLPGRVIVVGGGYIGVEFAGIFHGLGAQVTLVHRGGMLLQGFDDDCREFLAEEMTKRGIKLRFDARVRAVTREERPEGPSFMVDLTGQDGETIEAGLVMFATGRRPASGGLGLEQVGVERNERGAIRVDEEYRTSVPNIFAIGDVTDRINLTPVALAEGHALADTLFGGRPRRVGYEFVPTAVFSQPSLGTVGLTEAQARARLGAVDIYKTSFRPMLHTLSRRDERTLMKLVVERASQRVVGLHMVGPHAGETVQGFAVALNAGATKADFDRTIGIHPTAAEEFVTMRTREPDPAEPRRARC